MKKFISLPLACFLIVVFAAVATSPFVGEAYAKVEKVKWCHVEPNGNQETLDLPMSALINAGHVSASGNPLHAGDHPGECEDEGPPPDPCPNGDFNGSEPGCGTPPEVCEDPAATNYGQEGECQYPPPPPGALICKDPKALNYGQKGGCQYPKPGEECQRVDAEGLPICGKTPNWNLCNSATNEPCLRHWAKAAGLGWFDSWILWIDQQTGWNL